MQNPINPLDAENDGSVSPLDVLVIINDINVFGSRHLPSDPNAIPPPPYLDVDGDDFSSPLDILRVINFLNQQSSGGEGERSSFALERDRTKLYAGDAIMTANLWDDENSFSRNLIRNRSRRSFTKN